MADGQVVFEIDGDSRKVTASVKEVTNFIQQESKKWDDASDKAVDGMSNSFEDFARTAASAIGAAKIGSMILDWGKAAVSAASDLAEVQNVVDVTFGESASQIESWSKSAGQQFGLTETQAKKFTSTLGAMMKSAGMSGNEIVEMSTDLAGLAADMASFYNLDFETAFQKIRSGISGETEPLKQLGVNMSVANLEAYALEKGITKAFNAMTQQEQTILRYQYLMQATADAQGDFARTSDGFANAMRRMETGLNTITTAAGNVILSGIEPLVTSVADLMTKLTQSPRETLFDKLKNIDIERDAKVREIEDVASHATNLIEKLDYISGTDADDAMRRFAQGANTLDSSAPGIWQALFTNLQGIDGLQNLFGTGSATTNIEGLVKALSSAEVGEDKAKAWKTLLDAFGNNSKQLSELTGMGEEGTAKWLSELAESVNSIDASDAEAWDKLLTTLVQGLSGDTSKGKEFFQGLTQEFLAMGTESDVAIKGLEALGYTSEQIESKQAEWLKTCKELTATIPGLSEVVNTQTGEIQGGIGAFQKYVDEWKTAQEKLIYWKAFYQKKAAVQEEQSNLYSYEIGLGGAQIAFDNYLKNHQRLAQIYQNGGLLGVKDYGGNEARELIGLYQDLTDAQIVYNTALEQTSASQEQLANEEQYLTERFGEYTEVVNEAGEAVTSWSADQTQAMQTATAALEESLKNLADYVQNVKNSTEQAVNGIVKGFDTIIRPTNEVARQISDLTDQFHNGAISQDEYEKKVASLQDTLNTFSVEKMSEGLTSQLSFMDEYISNLEYLQKAGLSDALLSQFVDGSTDSAERLSGIVDTLKTGGEEGAAQVAKLDEQFQSLQAKKDEFIEALSEQKLKSDETYQQMQEAVEKAYQAMTDAAGDAAKDMDISTELSTSMQANMTAISAAISEHTDEVASAVDGVIEQLQRLNDFKVNISINAGGGLSFGESSESNNNSSWGKMGNMVLHPHETGLDFVPFNGYLAELHAGEGILTAEENRIWQRFRNGSESTANVDYDTLGSVMADSVRPGGDVYLDGRIVGSVISKQQAASYRSMQRSGWQA